jgi:hypothetical protein
MKVAWWKWDDRRVIQDFFWLLWKLGLNKNAVNMNDNWLKIVYWQEYSGGL